MPSSTSHPPHLGGKNGGVGFFSSFCAFSLCLWLSVAFFHAGGWCLVCIAPRHLSQQPYRHVQAFQWGSCLTSILLANCKAWTQGKNETEICVITTLCQHILHKLQTSESLTLALNVSHWRVLGLKFEKGQHSTFCIWSAPEPTGLWQAVPPVEHLASSDLTRTTPCPNYGFSMRRNLKFFHAMKTGWLYQY